VALSIKHPEADRLARELAARTGETLTEAVVVALRERLARETGRDRAVPLREELAAIRRRCASLPVVDSRSAEEILRGRAAGTEHGGERRAWVIGHSEERSSRRTASSIRRTSID
jgi:antitoxin VapB